MVRHIIWFLLIGLFTAGCVSLTQDPEILAQLQVGKEKILELEKFNATLVAKHEAGELSTQEFTAALKANMEGIAEARALYKKAEEMGASATDAVIYGGIGGTVARTALHASRGVIPLLPLWAQGLANLLLGAALGGSGGLKKKKLVDA